MNVRGPCPLEIVLALTPRTSDMIIDNDPPLTRNVSVPKDMSQLSCSSFTAGVVEAVLDGLGFVRRSFLLLYSMLIIHSARAGHGSQHAN